MVVVSRFPGTQAELQAMGQLLLRWKTLALLPIFAYSNWYITIQFSVFNTRLFDARTEGLTTMVYYLMQMAAAPAFGWVLDKSTAPSHTKVTHSFPPLPHSRTPPAGASLTDWALFRVVCPYPAGSAEYRGHRHRHKRYLGPRAQGHR